jgi:hypothetical protein
LERVIATLTISFGLISTQPAFSRDLNSLLPGFFSTLLKLASQNALLPATLKALHSLIPDHANAFRPSLGIAEPLILSLIDGPHPADVKRMATKVYVDLHHSAQKGASSDHWRTSLLGITSEIHTVLDRMFDVIEEGMWQVCFTHSDRLKMTMSKGVGLRPLDGGDYTALITAGMDRIQILLVVLTEFLRLTFNVFCL